VVIGHSAINAIDVDALLLEFSEDMLEYLFERLELVCEREYLVQIEGDVHA
jgi:hypothetical protein